MISLRSAEEVVGLIEDMLNNTDIGTIEQIANEVLGDSYKYIGDNMFEETSADSEGTS